MGLFTGSAGRMKMKSDKRLLDIKNGVVIKLENLDLDNYFTGDRFEIVEMNERLEEK
jgi:hypothetical protein